MCCFEKQLCFVLFVAMGWDRRTEKVGKHLDKGAEGTVLYFQQLSSIECNYMLG